MMTKYICFEKMSDHNHESLENKSSLLSTVAQQKTIEFHELNYRTKAIHFTMSRNENFTAVTTNQIRGTIESYKLQRYGRSTETLESLEAFVNERKPAPENEHNSFIIGFEKSSKDDENVWFRYAVSTKRLLRSAVDAEKIHVDSTYKMIIQNCPVSVIGCTDMNRHFHPLAIMVSSNEKWEDY